jgi:hypothetical protein
VSIGDGPSYSFLSPTPAIYSNMADIKVEAAAHGFVLFNVPR